MNKFTITTTAALAGSALAAVIGLAGPADAAVTAAPDNTIVDYGIPARLDHNNWINDIGGFGTQAHAPRVDTSVHTSPRIGHLAPIRSR